MKQSVKYSGSSLLIGALLILVLPLKWICAMVFSIIIHEVFHFIAIRLTGNNVLRISVTNRRMIMQTTPLLPAQEFLCAIAGPLGSFILFMCYPWIPRISLCAFIHALFNLLPIYPLDGGRAVSALFHIWLTQQNADLATQWTERITIMVILFGGLYLTVRTHLGVNPLMVSLLLLSRCLSEKYLANKGI